MTNRSYEELTVPELKDLLRDNGLPVSGKKSELIKRATTFIPEPVPIAEPPKAKTEVTTPHSATMVLEEDITAESPGLMAEDDRLPWWRSTELMSIPALTAIGVALLMVTAVFVFQPAWIGFTPDYDY